MRRANQPEGSMDAQGRSPRRRGQRVSIGEAEAFIRRHIAENPKATYTSALTVFRESGFGLEQSRFREVFRQVREQSGRS